MPQVRVAERDGWPGEYARTTREGPLPVQGSLATGNDLLQLRWQEDDVLSVAARVDFATSADRGEGFN
jgi:hypothetical protein